MENDRIKDLLLQAFDLITTDNPEARVLLFGDKNELLYTTKSETEVKVTAQYTALGAVNWYIRVKGKAKQFDEQNIIQITKSIIKLP
jgi:hypothetical protein